MNDYENYISTQEACELYKVSISTLRKWDREGINCYSDLDSYMFKYIK